MSDQVTAAHNSRPLFVLSVWRSGSSLLYALLNQHSEIGLMYEGDLPRLHRFLSGRFRNGTWRERWEFWNQGPSRHGIAIESLPESVSDAWEATRIVYQEVARRKQATIWGEKTPHWYNCPLQMAEKFPDARFIFLWRDTKAVLRSVASAARTDRFFRKAGFLERILIGNENLRNACDALTRQGRSVNEVNYEDLTANPSECMQDICRFLQVPFEERMTSLEDADRSAVSSGSHHMLVRGDLILGQGNRTEALSPRLNAKIDRYVCRWKQSNKGKWPKYPLVLPTGTRPPSLLEICRDQIFYQVFRGHDSLVAHIYAAIPIDIARSLRSWVRQRGPKRRFFPVSQ